MGSGDWIRYGAKATCEVQQRIDIRYFKKIGVLDAPGCSGKLAWESRGKPAGSIRYSREGDSLVLSYKARSHGGNWRDVDQHVLLDRTVCHFGGYRYWLNCPDCGRRVAVLYGAGIHFLCRHCYNLAYTSQNETRHDRLIRREGKLRVQLGVISPSEPVLFKPKYMHQKTFDRLRQEHQSIRDAALSEWVSLATSLHIS